MTPKERVLSAIRGEETDRVPASCVTQLGLVEAMEITGARWPDAHRNADAMALLGASLYRIAGLEAARIPFCLTVQAEAMGCPVDLGTMEQTPAVVGPAFRSVDGASLPEGFIGRGRIPAVLKATRMLRDEHPDLPVIVGIEGICTLAGHLVGIERLMRWSIVERDRVARMLDLAMQANTAYAVALIAAGADVICVSDPTASPDLLSPRDFASLIKPRLKGVADAIRKSGGLGVLHVCGRAQRICKEMAETGFDGLSVEERVDIAQARALIGAPRPALIGNVAAAGSLFSGTAGDVLQESKRALMAGVSVLAPGCGLVARTPLANIRALAEAAVRSPLQSVRLPRGTA